MNVSAALVGCSVDQERPWITIAAIREGQGDLLISVRIDPDPGRPPETRWFRCGKFEPDVIRQLVSAKLADEEDSSIADIEPPADQPCGGWLAPDGRLWRCSDWRHQRTATEIAERLHLPIGSSDPADYLERHNWQHIMDCGHVRTDGQLTQKQRDQLFELARSFPTMRAFLLDALREDRDG